jgi:voltage-gated potassium channel
VPSRLGALRPRGEDYVLVAVRAGEEWLFNPGEDFVLQPGYIVVAMASAIGRSAIEAHLAEFSS